jgi:hypothetical protein
VTERPAWLGTGRDTWLIEVQDWVTSVVLATDGGRVLAIESVKENPWGAVLRVHTPSGVLYFKAPGPFCRHELRLIHDLGERWPTLVPDVVAVDNDRSWLLLEDHGVPMHDLDAREQVGVLEGLLPAYAEMQAATTHHLADWLAIGTPDRRIRGLPDQLESLLRGASPIGPLPMDDADRGTYLDGLPTLSDVCAELADTPVPDALDHADLHGTNVFVDGPEARMADWGDACITHPFSSLFVPYAYVVASLPTRARRAATLRLRDIYLASWGRPADHHRAFGLAIWIAYVTRALNVAAETLGEPDDHEEIGGLLSAWHAKRSLLDRPDDLVQTHLPRR